MVPADLSLTQRLIEGDLSAFEEAFNTWYSPLVNFATGILYDSDWAEDQVQEIFIRLWEKRQTLNPSFLLFPYLLTSVRNRCMNALEHRKVQRRYVSHTQHQYQSEILNYDYDGVREDLFEKLQVAVQELPEKCREVFELSRFKGLSHQQIHHKLNISTKTIENHITKALKLIRKKVGNDALILVGGVGVFMS